MSYQVRKKIWRECWTEKENKDLVRGREEGMFFAEQNLEDEFREGLMPFANFLQTVATIIDTKKETKREELLNTLINNQSTIAALKSNLRSLLNITRI